MKTTKRNVKRLLNVAKALDESKTPQFFNMGNWGWNGSDQKYLNTSHTKPVTPPCGTPACALGHFASRKDLQHRFYLDSDKNSLTAGKVKTSEGDQVCDEFGLNGPSPIVEYFGLEQGEVDILFDWKGCGGAKTAKQASKFIKDFVKAQVKLNAKRA